MNRKYHYLLTYLERQNKINAVFHKEEAVLTLESCKDPEVYKNIYVDLDGSLSPENLCCDGELRGRALETKRRHLLGAWRDLNALNGLNIDYDSPEVEEWQREWDLANQKKLSFLKPAIYLA